MKNFDINCKHELSKSSYSTALGLSNLKFKTLWKYFSTFFCQDNFSLKNLGTIKLKMSYRWWDQRKKNPPRLSHLYVCWSLNNYFFVAAKKTNAKGKNCNFSRPSRSLYKIDSLMPEKVRLLIVLGTLPCVD